MNKLKPFLKWAGSKYNCISQVINSLPKGSRLVEPFTGSGVVFMNAPFSTYLLSESNPDLVNLFVNLQRDGEQFINFCQQYFQPQSNKKEVYYELRSYFNTLDSSHLKSAIFLYLNRHGYNGLCRYNLKGHYNVPFGSYKRPYFPRKEMLLFYQKSQSAEFTQCDFRKTFELVKPGDVVYCDPPYVPYSDTTKPHLYTQYKFNLDDQIELAELASKTASIGIPVLISNHDTPFTRYHYRNAQINSFSVPRWINCRADKRQPVKELIAVFS